MKKKIIIIILTLIAIGGMFKYLEYEGQRDKELLRSMSNYQECVIDTYVITVNDFIEQDRELPVCEK